MTELPLRTSERLIGALDAAGLSASPVERPPLEQACLAAVVDVLEELTGTSQPDVVYGASHDVLGVLIGSELARRVGATVGFFGFAEGLLTASPPPQGSQAAVVVARLDDEEMEALAQVLANAGATLGAVIALTSELP